MQMSTNWAIFNNLEGFEAIFTKKSPKMSYFLYILIRKVMIWHAK